MFDIQKMIHDYADWIKNEITCTKIGEYYEIVTPFLDRFNDYLQIYIKQNPDGTFLLTDDGYIISNLISSGFSLRNNSERKKILDRKIKNYALVLDGDSITATANAKNFPQRKQALVQAMLEIDDMFELKKESIQSLFVEDIANYFDTNKIYYSRDFPIMGKTGNLYNYEFHFQKTSSSNERFCKAINRLTKSNRDLTIFNWIDTKDRRVEESLLYVIVNDVNRYTSDDINAFTQYNIKTIQYSKISENKSLFA